MRWKSDHGDADPLLLVTSIGVGLILTGMMAGLITMLGSWVGVAGANATADQQLKVAGHALSSELQEATSVTPISSNSIYVVEAATGGVVVDPHAPKTGCRWQRWDFGSEVRETVAASSSCTTAPATSAFHQAINVPQVTAAKLTLVNRSGRTLVIGAGGKIAAPIANPNPSKIEGYEWSSNAVRVVKVDVTSAVLHPHANPTGRPPTTPKQDTIGGTTNIADATNFQSIGSIPSEQLTYYQPQGVPSATLQGTLGTTGNVAIAAGAPSGPACGALAMKSASVAVTPVSATTGGTGATTLSASNIYFTTGVKKTLTMPAGSAYDVVETLTCFPQPSGNQKSGTIPGSTKVSATGVTSSGTMVTVPLNAPKPTVSWQSGAQTVKVSWPKISTITTEYHVTCSLSLSGSSWSAVTQSTSASWQLAAGAGYAQTASCSVWGRTSVAQSKTGTAAAGIPWPSVSIRPGLTGTGHDGENPTPHTVTVVTSGGCPAGTWVQTEAYDAGYGAGRGGWVGAGASYYMPDEQYSTTYLAQGAARCANAVSVSGEHTTSAGWTTGAPPPPPPVTHFGVGSDVCAWPNIIPPPTEKIRVNLDGKTCYWQSSTELRDMGNNLTGEWSDWTPAAPGEKLGPWLCSGDDLGPGGNCQA